MTAPPDHLALAADFPAASREQWRALVASVLAKTGGTAFDTAAPETALSSSTYDGIVIQALYTAADVPGGPDEAGQPGCAPFVRGATAEGAVRTGWDVRQLLLDPDAERANKAALTDLENGASSLWLQLGAGAIAVEELARVLDGVHLDLAPIVLDAGAETLPAAEALLWLVAERGTPRGELAGSLGADPIGLAARTAAAPELSALVAAAGLGADYPNLRAGTVDATIYHDAGASDADELAISISVGLAYLRTLTEAGLGIDDALAQLEFRYAVSADQFTSIAKLRAARRIWDRVAELSGAAARRRGQRQHAVTAAAMMTRRDPWVNMLRTTIGCFAAAVGGADAITVAPFDSAIGLPDDFGRRIARNTQSILHEETSLARVIDPAGGSWYVESLTSRLAEIAWDRFTSIERAGGAIAALESGLIENLLAGTRDSRRHNLAHRHDRITGVTEYALAGELAVRRPAAAARPSGGLPRWRYAEDFEALAERSDAQAGTTGSRPKVFLAALGPARASARRLAFASNLLQIAGIEPVVGGPDGLAEAFTASGATLACLCSSDSVYASDAQPAAAGLKVAGAAQVWVAGAPELVSGDIDAAMYAGCDALAVLRSILDCLGVAG